jgi:hypothetical protein
MTRNPEEIIDSKSIKSRIDPLTQGATIFYAITT